MKEAYLKDPCGTLSIPWWKSRTVTVPSHMQILHRRAFEAQRFQEYRDEPYFRLFHSLKEIGGTESEDFWVRTAAPDELPVFADVINRSYADLTVTLEQLTGYTKTDVYDPDLWVLVLDKAGGDVAGCGIAELDREMGEGVLEWIQVLPAYRGRKAGQLLVNELLRRLSVKAGFATVSGKVRDPSKPELLYRRCGFTGNDVWHVLRKAERSLQ